ncbi:type II toxin-antitoxin system VapC family toxin [Nostoc sp. FACHB-87]|uniref:type II toxin-antitoxin system VapC family toxin n=1 Tax=Nostocales TaxID=1161 RepID=UPI00168788EC|nr:MULTISPECIES: type II toxin-antitoxin system VapC family toxin [Nostocales]MBD2455511.1 type II toxin-antitoxin system VapC family toxin [Nostoc sp. FACHB-87]MBD2478596.1 type II toxin-antitoxin system VapC family toxin [Anabaena sp. FACHB-83]MBD2487793.1 type II toxin-antitoxin system VapC family toxin [Aulosira sp. FACHB-615]
MSLWILDTDSVSLFQNGHPLVSQRVSQIAPDNIAVTIITFEEQIRGRFNVIRQTNSLDKLVIAYSKLQATYNYFNSINLLTFTQEAANCYARFLQQKIRIGTQDLRIAAIVIANDAILVTRNQRDFCRVPGLRFEDWTLGN